MVFDSPSLKTIIRAAAVAFFLINGTAQANAAVPSQFIAKLYTEALGRAPDASGWSSRINYFQSNSCNVGNLQVHGQDVLLSSEFANLNYSNAAKLLLLYRTVLDREPDASSYTSYLNQLNSGTPFATVVGEFFSSPEFSQLSTKICSGQPYYFNMLGYGKYAIQIPGVPQLTRAQLQSELDAAGPGGVVALPSMTVVYVDAPIVIPSGVTLTTAGNPLPSQHGNMARIVRDPSYSAGQALVQLQGGARLTNVWIDGQRGAAGYSGTIAFPFVSSDINIQARSGTGTTISSNFISNTAGWSSLQAFGHYETGVSCQANVINGNVITNYASNNGDTNLKSWSDGISDSCEDSTVASNQIVDATDAAIVLFRAQVQADQAVQKSQVTDNVILNAGNSAYAAIAVDPLYVSGGCPVHPSFAGSYVGRNVFWTGPVSIIEIGLAVGTSEWYFSSGGCIGTGANVSDNSSNGFRVRVNDGIAVQGMLNATVQSNNLLTSRTPKGHCPSYDVSAGVGAGIASGSIQPYVNTALKDCI
jgi:hypothetical protein